MRNAPPLKTVSECVHCGKSFGSSVEMREHIRKAHVKGRIEEPKEPQVDKKPTEEKLQTAGANPQVSTPPTSPQTQVEPIILEYKYKGVDTCGDNVVTLETDIGDKHFVIAYCLREKKQIEVREVPRLYDKEKVPNLPKRE